MKLNKDLKKKLTSYAAVAGALAVTLSGCKKDEEEDLVTETDVNPDVSIAPSVNSGLTYDIDINSDGTIDVKLGVYNYVYTPDNTNYGYGYAQGQNGAQILTQNRNV